MEAVEFRDVSFSYAGCEREALKNIDLVIHPSEFTVICGKSGCGKSTLLRQLKKNLIPYGYMEGQVLCFGTKVDELKDRESAGDIGFVQQNPDNQIVTDKVWHELAFGLESLGYDNGTMKRKVAEMASFFGMQTWFEKDIRELSGGQKQLLNLASIMVLQPKLLILDEPTAQLDPIAASDFLHTLEKINRELGTTILISEHRLEEIFPMVDRVVVMEEGRILIHDTPRKVATFLALGENKNDMFHGLPSVTKLYSLLAQKGDCPPPELMSECPLSVREGRLWLTRLLSPRLEETSKTAGKWECFKQPIRTEDSSTGDIQAAASEPEPIKHAPERSHKRRKPEEYAIYIEDLWFRYQRTGSDILRGVNLKVERGEWLCLLGGNGVGKSTTLKALCGLIKPYRGYAMADGIRVEKKNEGALFDHCLSMLPQNPQAMFTEITVEEELLEALHSFRLSDQERIRRVESMLEQGECAESREYLEQFRAHQPRAAALTGNLAVDALLTAKRSILQEKGIAFSFQAYPLQGCPLDDVELCTVLGNLLDNAIKFDPVGGEIRLRLHCESTCIRITVSDNGPGIPKDQQSAIFERFYQADGSHKSEGNGLGLAIGKHIVQPHGRILLLESAGGKGHSFTVTLPLAKDNA